MTGETDWGLLVRPSETMIIVLLLLLVPHLYTVYLIGLCLLGGGGGYCIASFSTARMAPFLVTAIASYIVAGAIGNVLWPRYVQR